MQNINVVVITGNLTRDPELRSTPGGTSVCKLRVAVNSRRKDGTAVSGSISPTTSTRRSLEPRLRAARKYLAKGRAVAVEGRLDWREWEAQDGRQAPGRLDHRQLGPVPRQPRRRMRPRRAVTGGLAFRSESATQRWSPAPAAPGLAVLLTGGALFLCGLAGIIGRSNATEHAGSGSELDALPRIDEHSAVIDRGVQATWAALLHVLGSMLIISDGMYLIC